MALVICPYVLAPRADIADRGLHWNNGCRYGSHVRTRISGTQDDGSGGLDTEGLLPQQFDDDDMLSPCNVNKLGISRNGGA